MEIEDFDYAIDRVLLGNLKSNEDAKDQRLKLAYTEAGIAATAILTNSIDSLHRITLLKKGKSVKRSTFVGSDSPQLYTQKLLDDRIQMLMGCRAAEEVFFGKEETSLRCGEYMKMATELGFKYTKDFNLADNELKLAGKDLSNESKSYHNNITNAYLERSYTSTVELLKQNKDLVENIATELSNRESLTVTELKNIGSMYS